MSALQLALIESGVLLAVAICLQAAGCLLGLRMLQSTELDDASEAVTIGSGVKTFAIVLGCLVLVLGIGVFVASRGSGASIMDIWLGVVALLQVNTLRFGLRLAGVSWPSRWVAFVLCLGVLGVWLRWRNWLTGDLLAFVGTLSAMASFAMVVMGSERMKRHLLSVPLWAAASLAAALFDLATVFGTQFMRFVADKSVQASASNAVTMPYVGNTPTAPVAAPLPIHHSWFDTFVHAPPALVIGVADILFPGWLLLVMALWARHFERRRLVVLPFLGYLLGGVACVTVVLTTNTAQPALPYLFGGVFLGIVAAAVNARVGRTLFAVRLRNRVLPEVV